MSRMALWWIFVQFTDTKISCIFTYTLEILPMRWLNETLPCVQSTISSQFSIVCKKPEFFTWLQVVKGVVDCARFHDHCSYKPVIYSPCRHEVTWKREPPCHNHYKCCSINGIKVTACLYNSLNSLNMNENFLLKYSTTTGKCCLPPCLGWRNLNLVALAFALVGSVKL